MRTSKFLGLILPELPDEADIRVISNDLDTVDGAIKDLSESTAEAGRDIEALETTLGNKVDKVTGKGLSSEDYTTTEKNKLSGIEAQANRTIVDSEMSSSSTNPVQNKVIKAALDQLPKVVISETQPAEANCLWIKTEND